MPSRYGFCSGNQNGPKLHIDQNFPGQGMCRDMVEMLLARGSASAEAEVAKEEGSDGGGEECDARERGVCVRGGGGKRRGHLGYPKLR